MEADISGAKLLAIIAARPAMGKALALGDLARVRQAPDLRRGIADLDGEGECVGGIVIAAKGVNALDLARRAKAALAALHARFSDQVVAVDRVNFNSSRIWKLAGTFSSCPPRSTKLVRPMKPATKRVFGRLYSVCGSSTCSMRPRFITAMRSEVTIASAWSWVT